MTLQAILWNIMSDVTLWFDVSDLVRHHGAWTGIQRVVASFATGLQDCRDPFALRYCYFQRERGFVAMDAPAVEDLIGGLHQVRDKPKRGWLDKLNALVRSTPTAYGDPFRPADLLMNLGLYTYKEEWRPVVAEILARKRIRYVGFVHDLMHADFPEWWSPREQTRIVGWYRFVFRHAATLICASAATRNDTERFLVTEKLPQVPIVTTGLAGTLFPPPESALSLAVGTGPIEPPYVLFVSTLETRKNHRLLFYLWRRLRERLGDARLPTLLLVGKKGHLIDDLLTELDNCRYLDGKIRWLQRVTDTALAWLYRHSLFTVYPSLYEGWGLPVAESLAFGKYCIAANSGALPEVGGAFLDYHDPLDLPFALDLVTRAIVDPAYVAVKEAEIARAYRPLSWQECARAATTGLASLPLFQEEQVISVDSLV